RGDEADWAELRAHSPAQHHLAGDLGDLPEVVLAARGDDAVDELFGRAAAERTDDARAEIVLRVVRAVVGRELIGRPERHTSRDDRHAVHRVAARNEQPEQRVPALVVSGALAG